MAPLYESGIFVSTSGKTHLRVVEITEYLSLPAGTGFELGSVN